MHRPSESLKNDVSAAEPFGGRGRSTDGGGEVRPELLPFPDGVYAACCVNDTVCMSALSPGCRSTRRANGGARDVLESDS